MQLRSVTTTEGSDDVEAEIEYYESLTDAQVDAELRRYGIDPAPAIAAVTALVAARVGEWRRRRGPM